MATSDSKSAVLKALVERISGGASNRREFFEVAFKLKRALSSSHAFGREAAKLIAKTVVDAYDSLLVRGGDRKTGAILLHSLGLLIRRGFLEETSTAVLARFFSSSDRSLLSDVSSGPVTLAFSRLSLAVSVRNDVITKIRSSSDQSNRIMDLDSAVLGKLLRLELLFVLRIFYLTDIDNGKNVRSLALARLSTIFNREGCGGGKKDERVDDIDSCVALLCAPENEDVALFGIAAAADNLSSITGKIKSLPLLVETAVKILLINRTMTQAIIDSLLPKLIKALSWASQESFKSSLLPIILKAAAKAKLITASTSTSAGSEHVLKLLAFVLSSLPFEKISDEGYASSVRISIEDAISPLILSNAAHLQYEYRLGSSELAFALSSRFVHFGSAGSSNNNVSSVVSSCCATLGPKKASVPMWQSRIGLVCVLGSVANGLERRLTEMRTNGATVSKISDFVIYCQKLASEVCSALLSLKEAHDVTRRGLVRCIGRWLPLLLLRSSAEEKGDVSNLAKIPESLASFLIAGLKSAGAGGEDSHAESIYIAIMSPVAKLGASAAIAESSNISEALFSLLGRTAAVALAAPGPARKSAMLACPNTNSPFSAVFALSTLLRLAGESPSVLNFLDSTKLDVSVAASSGGADSAAASVPAAKKATAPAAPTATSSTKGKAAAATTKPSAVTSSSSSSSSLNSSLEFWDFFTHSILAPSVLFHPSVVNSLSRSVTDVEAVSPATVAAADCIQTALSRSDMFLSSSRISLFGEKMIAAVSAEFMGKFATTSSSSTSTSSSSGSSSTQSIDLGNITTRKPSSFMGGLLALLLHALPEVRKIAAASLSAFFDVNQSSAAADSMTLCLTHALWYRARESDVVAPTGSSVPSPFDTGIGDGPLAESAIFVSAMTGTTKLASPTSASGSGGAVSVLSASNAPGFAVLSTIPSSSTSAEPPVIGSSGFYGNGVDEGRTLGFVSIAIKSPGNLRQHAFPPVPSPKLFQFALTSIISSTSSKILSRLLPIVLLICSHPACSARSRSILADKIGRTRNGGAAAALAQGMLAYESSLYPSLSVSAMAGSGGGAMHADKLWKAVLMIILKKVSSFTIKQETLSPSTDSTDSTDSLIALSTDGYSAEVVKRLSPFLDNSSVSLDSLLQTDDFSTAILSLLGISSDLSVSQSLWGVLAPSHSLRVTSSRACALLSSGTAWMEKIESSSTVRNDANNGVKEVCGSRGSGARGLVVRKILPSLLKVFSSHIEKEAAGQLGGMIDCITDADIAFWKHGKDGSILSPSDLKSYIASAAAAAAAAGGGGGVDSFPVDFDTIKRSMEARWFRVRQDRVELMSLASSSNSVLPSEVTSESSSELRATEGWVLALRSDLEHKKRTEAKEAAWKAAASSGGKVGGKGGVVRIDDDDLGGRVMSGKQESKKGAVVPDDARGQAAARFRVQQLYSTCVGCLYTLSAIFTEFAPLSPSTTASTSSLHVLTPQIQTALLPLLGSPMMHAHASFCLSNVLRCLLLSTPVAVPALPPGLVNDWVRALCLVQTGFGSGPITSSHIPSGGAFTGGYAIATAYESSSFLPTSKIALTSKKSQILDHNIPLTALSDEGDESGAVGANLTPHASLLQRVLTTLAPRLIARGEPGGLPREDAGGYDGGSGQLLDSDDSNRVGMMGAATLSPIAAANLRPGPLSSNAYLLLFPVLRAVLTSRPPLPFVQQALSIVAAHAKVEYMLPMVTEPISGSTAELSAAEEDGRNLPTAMDLVDSSLVNGCLAGSEANDERALAFEFEEKKLLFLPLGPGLSDGGAKKPFGVRSAWELFSTLASISAKAYSAISTSAYLSIRLYRESLVLTVLSVLRSNPRLTPSPDLVLLSLVRGGVVPSYSHIIEEEGKDSLTEERSLVYLSSTASVADRLLTLSIGESGPLIGSAGLLSPFAHVRNASLMAIEALLSVHTPSGGLRAAKLDPPFSAPGPPSEWAEADRVSRNEVSIAQNLILTRLWVALHDEDEDNAALSQTIWRRAQCSLSQDLFAPLVVPLLSHPSAETRRAAGRALASAARIYHPATTDTILRMLLLEHGLYADPSTKGVIAAQNVRESVIGAMSAFAAKGCVLPQQIPVLLPFLISKGLSDETLEVRQQALALGKGLVALFGRSHTKLLLPVCETFLDQGPKSTLAATNEAQRDAQREAVAIILGSAAKYLPPNDPKMQSILKLLVSTLDTPSEPVQRAVAQCISPLCKAMKSSSLDASVESRAAELITSLQTKLFNKKESFASRRGAAFGLGGVVNGFGLPSLKQSGLLQALESAAGEAKDPFARQSSMIGFECLCDGLGMLFEPYVSRVLPILLKGVGDPNKDVQEAANYAAKAVMAILTSHGVSLVMPAVLRGLAESAWRSKQASIQLLGSMAFCAPRILSRCLPSIVPRLVEAFEDPHPNVQKAGKEALEDIGKVIRNPEIRSLAPVLHLAVSNPSNKTKDALTALASTDFVHAVDAPSLALVVPIVRRGLLERVTSIKIQAATIAGNMCALVADPIDLVPYLNQLMPPLRKTVVDPIPDVRACSARALGSLVRGLGVSEVPDLIPWLIGGLSSEVSTVERSGAAQSLVNVLHALGDPILSQTIVSLLPLATAQSAAPREGLLWVAQFLPRLIGPSFASLLPKVFPIVINSLADDAEGVRDVGQRCAKTIVSAHGKSDPSLVVPVLEAGLCDPAWRVRQATVTLSGQLLMEIANMPQRTVIAGNTGGAGPGEGGEEDEDLVDEWASESEPGLSDLEERAERERSEKNANDAAAVMAAAAADELDAAALAVGSRPGKEKRNAALSADETGNGSLTSPTASQKAGGSWRAAVTVGGGKKDDEPAVEKKERRRKRGERGVVDPDAALPMQRKSNKIRQPSAAKLAALQAAGMIVGMESVKEKGKEMEDENDTSGEEGDDEFDDEFDDGLDEEDEEDEDEDEEDDDEEEEKEKENRKNPALATAATAATSKTEDRSGASLLAQMDSAARAQVHVLGLQARSSLLAGLYQTRSDTSQVVRQSSLSVWKAIVSNTPRTLREILPSLIRNIVRDLASVSDERRLVSSRCLGDVVRKLGERVLPEVIPVLRKGLSDPAPNVRTGVCIGLSEVVESATRSQIEGYIGLIIPALKDALCDPDSDVREAASRAFTSLQKVVGQTALDTVLPSLLSAIEQAGSSEDGDSDETWTSSNSYKAIEGLKSIVASRIQATLPHVLPTLLALPITVGRALALAAVAEAAAGVLHYHALTILPPIVTCLAGEEELFVAEEALEEARASVARASKKTMAAALANEQRAAAKVSILEHSYASITPEKVKMLTDRLESRLGGALGRVLPSVSSGGVSWVLQETVKYLNSPSPNKRAASAFLIKSFIAQQSHAGQQDALSPQVTMLLRELLNRLTDGNDMVLRTVCDALAALCLAVPPDEAATHLDFIRSCLSSISSEIAASGDGSTMIPGLCLQKGGGLEALFPIYQRALLNGNAEARESAATGIGELVQLASDEALKPLWVKLTGPLIRVVADKFPWNIKAAILKTLSLVISRAGAALKPFQPQLQASFVKSLIDPVAAVRKRGAEGLGKLMIISTRIDALLLELATMASSNGAGGIGESVCDAIFGILIRVGGKTTSSSREKIIEVCLPLLTNREDDATRKAAANVLASAMRFVESPASVENVLNDLCLSGDDEIDDQDDEEGDPGAEGGGRGSNYVTPRKEGRCLFIISVLQCAPNIASSFIRPGGPVHRHLLAASKAVQASVRETAARALGFAVSHASRRIFEVDSEGVAATSDLSLSSIVDPGLTSKRSGNGVRIPDPSLFTNDVVSAFQAAQPALLLALKSLLSDTPEVRKEGILASRRIARNAVSLTATGTSRSALTASTQALLPMLVSIASGTGGSGGGAGASSHILSYEADRALVHFMQFKRDKTPGGSMPLEGRGALVGVDLNTTKFLIGDFARKAIKRRDDEESDDEEVS